MEHFNNFSSPRRRNLWILLLCLMLARVVHSEYESVPAPPVLPGVGSTAGSGGGSSSLFCISDCETCPVICSPSTPPSPPTTIPTSTPPPPSTPPALPILFPPLSTAPPPEVHRRSHSPPTPLPPQLPYYFPSPTPESSLPYYNSPPSGGTAEKSAPPPPPPTPPPPPSFVSWGGDGTLPLNPPSSGYMPSVQTPNGMNQRNYSYPYYYYYASNASSSSSFAHLKESSFAITLFLLLSILV